MLHKQIVHTHQMIVLLRYYNDINNMAIIRVLTVGMYE